MFFVVFRQPLAPQAASACRPLQRFAMSTHQSAVATASVQIDLISAQRSHAIIDVCADATATMFQSTIVEVDMHAHCLVIDDLFPTGFSAARGQALTVTLRLSGDRRVSFATRLLAAHPVGNRIHYRLTLPDGFRYNQRRNAYRFRCSGHGEFTVGEGFLCAGSLQNISLTGLQLALQHRIPLQRDDLLNDLCFEFAGMTFRCRGVVRHVCADAGGCPLIGIEFRQMSRPQERMLEQVLARAHRQRARAAAEMRLALPG